jgi:hypothetical protein
LLLLAIFQYFHIFNNISYLDRHTAVIVLLVVVAVLFDVDVTTTAVPLRRFEDGG